MNRRNHLRHGADQHASAAVADVGMVHVVDEDAFFVVDKVAFRAVDVVAKNKAAQITGPATAEFFIAFMLGKSYLGMRCEDILACARHLGGGKPVRLVARGELGPPALHAAVLKLAHPADGRPCRFQAALPGDMRLLLDIMSAAKDVYD